MSRNGLSTGRWASPEMINSARPLTASSRNLSSFGSRQTAIRSVIAISSATASTSLCPARGITGSARSDLLWCSPRDGGMDGNVGNDTYPRLRQCSHEKCSDIAVRHDVVARNQKPKNLLITMPHVAQAAANPPTPAHTPDRVSIIGFISPPFRFSIGVAAWSPKNSIC